MPQLKHVMSEGVFHWIFNIPPSSTDTDLLDLLVFSTLEV